MEVYVATATVPNMELYGLEGLTGAIEVVVRAHDLVYDHEAVAGGDRDLLDDVVAEGSDGVEAPEIGAGDVDVVDALQIDEVGGQ